MSPSWRERLLIDIGAQEVAVRRYARGWRPHLLAETRAALKQSDADGLAQALAEALPSAANPAVKAHAQVVLSSSWVRFALLGSAASLRGADERAAAARHALRRVFGESAERWRVSASLSGPDCLVAAGIEEALLARIEHAVQASGARLTSLRPTFAAAVNRCRGWLDRPAWFVLLEHGRAVQCFSDGRQLRSVRSHRLRRGLHEDLPDWIEQGRLVDGLAEADTAVVLAYRGVTPPAVAALAGRLRLVDLDAAKAG